MVNIFRNQQNILLVCPTNNSGTRERMLLRDAIHLNHIGHNVFVYCYRDSFIDIECKTIGIDCLYHEGREHTKVLHWYKLRKLRGHINKFDVNVVHCYELNFLWPLSFFLKNKPYIALFFTLTYDVHRFYKQFWFRALLSRLDLVFLPAREMIESIHGHLDIPLRKIYFSGLGLKNVEFQKVKKKLDGSIWNLASWVNEHETNIDNLSVCLEALWSLNIKKEVNKPCYLHLYSMKKWEENIIYQKVLDKIKEYGLENFVKFHHESKIENINADIWISYQTASPLEDYSLTAILKGIPVLTPRNSTTQELNRMYGLANQTYFPSDSRELRTEIVEVIKNYEDYVTACESAREELWAEHGEEGYKYSLFRIYEKHLNKRKRFYS